MVKRQPLIDGTTGEVIKRHRQKHSKNPFAQETALSTKVGTKRLTNGEKALIVSAETGEVLAPAGFHQTIEVDKTQFVKLYINGVKAFADLSSSGTKVFEMLYNAVSGSINKDMVMLHHKISEKPIPKSTFNKGINELLDARFIAQSELINHYYINPDFIYNGNRLAFIKEYKLAGVKEVKKSIKEISKDSENN